MWNRVNDSTKHMSRHKCVACNMNKYPLAKNGCMTRDMQQVSQCNPAALPEDTSKNLTYSNPPKMNCK